MSATKFHTHTKQQARNSCGLVYESVHLYVFVLITNVVVLTVFR
jgi:hypothetical protein